jgi:hypothetical protein
MFHNHNINPSSNTHLHSHKIEREKIIMFFSHTKIQYKNVGQNHHRGNKKERPKKGQKMHNAHEPKKGRKLILFMVGSYFTHIPFNVT